MLQWYVRALADFSVRVKKYQQDGNGKGIVLNINHDIVPQAIGNTLTGVSTDKE